MPTHADVAAPRPTVVTVETPGLGDRSYLVHDGHTAFVIDPQRDIDRMLDVLQAHGVTLTHVFETHIHNDYLTGGLALARETGASYLLNAEDPVAFDREGLHDGDVLTVGTGLHLQVRATPGHTFTHLSYLLTRQRLPFAVFSGGSLLYGSAGRTDLLGDEHTDHLARLQHRSARTLAGAVPDDALLLPTHGFGSFCSVAATDPTGPTFGAQRDHNHALTTDEDTFLDDLRTQLGAYPTYYRYMGPANLAGPAAADLTPPPLLDLDQIRDRIGTGVRVVDVRHRQDFAAAHLPGTLSIGRDGPVATTLGWLTDPQAPLVLLAADAEELADAQRELTRIGVQPVAAALLGDLSAPDGRQRTTSYRTVTFADLAAEQARAPVTVLDVRRAEEVRAGRLPDAVWIPLHELQDRQQDVPTGELWVHCAGGYRAALAASLLAAAGWSEVVLVDDGFDNAPAAGLDVLPADDR